MAAEPSWPGDGTPPGQDGSAATDTGLRVANGPPTGDLLESIVSRIGGLFFGA